MSEKVCSKCKEVKPITDFAKHTRMWDGLRANCKKCANADASKRWHANPELSREKCRAARKKKKLPKPVALAPAPPGAKRCGVCKAVKPHARFHRNKNEPDNLSWMCRSCDSQKGRLAREKKWAEEGRVFAKPGHKICSGCAMEKEHSQFGSHYRTPDRLCCYCKECRSAQKSIVTRKRQIAERRISVIPGYKICKHCDKEMPLDQFKSHSTTPDGRIRCCMPCALELSRKWYLKNTERKLRVAAEWARNNPGKVNALAVKRNLAKINRTPKWLTQEDFEAISFIYVLAKAMEIATGEKHHVDHIIPLQSKKVSGLHVPGNLQILTATENCRKSNKWVIE